MNVVFVMVMALKRTMIVMAIVQQAKIVMAYVVEMLRMMIAVFVVVMDLDVQTILIG